MIRKIMVGIALFAVFNTFSAFAETGTTVQEPTIAVIGDSYSTFNCNESSVTDRTYYYPYYSGQNGNNVSSENQMWYEVLAGMINGKVTYIDAISGSELTSKGCYDKTAMSNRITSSKERLANIIILMGGINDIWKKRSVGPMTYSGENFFAAALRYSLKTLKVKNPNSEIVYCLTAFNNDDEYDYTKYLSAANAICDEVDVTFVPTYGIECASWHPTVKGMKQIAEQINKAMLADLQK